MHDPETEVSTVRTKPVWRGPYIKDLGLIFSRDYQTDEVNKSLLYSFLGQHVNSVTKSEHRALLNRTRQNNDQ